jgi:hypothetical protein
MFCYKTLPIPPRAWSRVQGPCSLIVVNEIDNQDYVTIPQTGKVVSTSQLGAELAMLNKGNVLQYKKNSSNLTKKQKYSQLAQGHRVSRYTTWATQSANGYTNPNIRCLERVNSETIVINPNSDNPTTIQDLGTLVCGTLENPITGVVLRQPPIPNCHLTTDSNVPGQIMSLCWNDGITPWYPRTRYTMTNSGNKWPTNATLISAVIVEPPILTLVSATVKSVSLSWTTNQIGLPISSYNIYQNYKLVANVSYPNNTITINDLLPGLIYIYYVTAVSNTYPIKSESRPSNIVSNTTIYFVVTGNPVQQVEGNQYTVAFTQNGSITFINPTKPQITLFCGGGGGGGGGGSYAGGGAGGGGGGGGITITTFDSASSTTYNAIVGSGGSKGNAAIAGSNGSNGSQGSNSTFTGPLVTCTGVGGYGGKVGLNFNGNGADGGASGTTGSVGGKGAQYNKDNEIQATSGTLGGGGGGGSYYNENASGANGSLNIAVINNNTNFGAGGGGGLALTSGLPGSGGNSNAGDGGNPGTNGKPNTGGGGGGGQAGNGGPGSSYDGGAGGSGIVVLYFLLS